MAIYAAHTAKVSYAKLHYESPCDPKLCQSCLRLVLKLSQTKAIVQCGAQLLSKVVPEWCLLGDPVATR